jgi:hypothetical protein
MLDNTEPLQIIPATPIAVGSLFRVRGVGRRVYEVADRSSQGLHIRRVDTGSTRIINEDLFRTMIVEVA